VWNGAAGSAGVVGTLLGPEGAGGQSPAVSSGVLPISQRSTVDVSCGRRVGAGGVLREDDWLVVENCTVDASIFIFSGLLQSCL
jgi:hypothetical protein